MHYYNKNVLQTFNTLSNTADSLGCYIIATGLFVNRPVILANLYVPNWDNDQFFPDLLYSLHNLDSHYSILGGNLNCCLYPIMY